MNDAVNHPRSWLVNGLCLPKAPMPESGEFFASWVARVGVMNGLAPRSLAVLANEGTRCRNWILNTPPLMIERLAIASGMKVNQLKSMTLVVELEEFKYPFVHLQDPGNWVIPIPDNRAMNPSLTQLCPDCLNSDRFPFLRKHWRFVYLTHCPIHRRRLLDECPSCGESMDPFEDNKLDVIRFQVGLFLRCPNCGFHLASIQPTWAQTEPPSVQRAIHLSQMVLRAINVGWIDLSDKVAIPVLLFLSGLRVILRLLGSRFGIEMRMWLEHNAELEQPSNECDERMPFMNFENLKIPDRTRLLAILDWLLEEWPTRWLEACAVSRLKGSFVLEQNLARVPFWLASTCCHPLLILNHPEAPWFPPTSLISGRGCGSLEIGLNANTFDKLDFIMEHPIWWEDIPQMALAMRDLGLYLPQHPLPKIETACKKGLKLISELHFEQQKINRSPKLSGLIRKRIMQRRFLLAFKQTLMKMLRLETPPQG